MDLTSATACELRTLLLARELTPGELLEACIERMDMVDGRINAITATCLDEARATAAAVGARLAAGDLAEQDPAALLAGLPLTIKDMTWTRGLRTTYGSLIYADFVPDRDDNVVRYIREAGGVIFAKTNTTEFGAGNNTTNAVFGATVNPFDPTRTSGGSSGGAAAALAVGMAPLCHGTDTGGSLRIPAAWCGVVSLKPTPGLVPFERRVFPLWPYMLQGPMARCVDDVGLFLAAMAVDDSADALSYPRDRGAFFPLAPADLGTLRVAFSADLGFAPTSAMIRECFAQRVARVRHLFQEADDTEPDIRDAVRVNWALRGLQYTAQHAGHYRDHKEKLSPNVRLNYEQALDLSVADVAEAFRLHGDLHREMDRFFRDVDVLICPTATVGPFPVTDHYVAEIDGCEMSTYVEWAGLTNALSTTGNPVVSLPCGRDADGLPFGLQIVGPRRSDARLLGIAKALEAVFAGDELMARPIPDL